MADEISYLDFEMTVEKSSADKYVIRAEFGDQNAQATFVNPFNEDKREIINSTLTAAALRRTAKTRLSNVPEVNRMKEFGGVLFDSLINGPLDDFYTKCRSLAEQECKGIRWRLSLDPTLEDLPWEFLSYRDRFLALDPRNPIVRYIKPDTWIAPLESEHPLRLLLVIAHPQDQVPLNTTEEKDRILGALKPLIDKKQIQVNIIEGPNTWEQLINKLLRDDTHILHFIGHGSFDKVSREGVLMMEDIDGNSMSVDSERLSVLMQGKSRLRLIVLNSCLGSVGDAVQPFSSVAAGMVRSGIPAVIAMQFEITDDAAREIAETFYTALALNRPVDAALTEARRKIYLTHENSLEWATPILYMQVPDGQLFQFTIKETTLSPDSAPPTVRGTLPVSAMLVRADNGEDFPLGLDLIRIGRGPDNDIHLPDPTVSRKHAILTRTGSTYMIQDVEGSSGTRVNGLAVTARQLKTDDVVRLGSVDLKFITLTATKSRQDRTTQAPAAEPVHAGPTDATGIVRTPVTVPAEEGGGIRAWYNKMNNMFAAPVPGSIAAEPPRAPEPEPPARTDFETRVYEIQTVDVKQMAESIRQYFLSNGFESQTIQQNATWIVQGRKTGWLKWMKQAGTVIIDPSENQVRVLTGGGGWLERGAAWATSLYLKPDWVNNALGMDEQKQLLKTLWELAESFLTAHGGKRIQ